MKKKIIYFLAIVGAICLVYLLAGFTVYREFGETDFASDHVWYYTSGLKIEHRWLRCGRGYAMKEIEKSEFPCPFRSFEKDYWFYREKCANY